MVNVQIYFSDILFISINFWNSGKVEYSKILVKRRKISWISFIRLKIFKLNSRCQYLIFRISKMSNFQNYENVEFLKFWKCRIRYLTFSIILATNSNSYKYSVFVIFKLWDICDSFNQNFGTKSKFRDKSRHLFFKNFDVKMTRIMCLFKG